MSLFQQSVLKKYLSHQDKVIKTSGHETLTKKEEFDWIELFKENKATAIDLQTQILAIENKIDIMIYDLYGLNTEEIKIVENYSTIK